MAASDPKYIKQFSGGGAVPFGGKSTDNPSVDPDDLQTGTYASSGYADQNTLWAHELDSTNFCNSYGIRQIMERGIAPWVAGYDRPKGSLVFYSNVVYETLVEITGNDVNIPPSVGNLYHIYNTNSVYPTDVWQNNRIYNYGDKVTTTVGGVKFSFVSIADGNTGKLPAFYGNGSDYWASTSRLAKYPAGEITPWFGNNTDTIPNWLKRCDGAVLNRSDFSTTFDKLVTYLRNIGRIVSRSSWNAGDKQTMFGYYDYTHSNNTPLNQITEIRLPYVVDSVIGMSRSALNLRLQPSVIPIPDNNFFFNIKLNEYSGSNYLPLGSAIPSKTQVSEQYQGTMGYQMTDWRTFGYGTRIRTLSNGRYLIQDPATAQVWPDRVMGYPVVNVAAIF